MQNKGVLINAAAATVELTKLAGYCLSSTHPRGRHKARVFRDALGVEEADAEWLRDTLLKGLGEFDATEVSEDAYGVRWRVDIPVGRQGRRAVIRSIWLVRGSEPPRFLTCWVL